MTLSSWSVTLTASSTQLWPTQYSTLTATANGDVGPTPYYIRLYDVYHSTYLATCGFGTTCTFPVTQTIPVWGQYIAVIGGGAGTYPPDNMVAQSWQVNVDWRTFVDNLHLRLSADPTTTTPGSSITLTATTSEDIGPSPQWVEIFDSTAQQFLIACGTGTSCSTTVSQAAATTHLFAAYFSAHDTHYTPTGTQQTAGFQYLTWSGSGWRVWLSATGVVNNTQTITATASGDVGPTPYWIEIFSLPTDHLIAACGSGSTCTVPITPSYNTDDVQAFVTTYTPNSFPFPQNVSPQASSNLVNNFN
jgi:hypothetical protein